MSEETLREETLSEDTLSAVLSGTLEDIRTWLNDEPAGGKPVKAQPRTSLLVTGAAGTGKTTVAFETLLVALEKYGADQAVMTVANRMLADTLIRQAVQRLGAIAVDRPVTTLSALAFKLASQLAAARHDKPIKLLNGAEQDAIIRTVIARHGMHVLQGDPCDVCQIIAQYFGTGNWLDIIYPTVGALNLALPPEALTEQIARDLNETLMNQLRDMLARIGECGVSDEQAQQLIDGVASADQGIEQVLQGERLAVQWRLAFALREQVNAEIARAYPHETRMDPTALIEAGYAAVLELDTALLPKIVIVDDAHDMTLAQLRMVTALYQRGVRILVTANADESVQSFRGAFPEYTVLRMTGEDIEAGSAESTHSRSQVYASLDNHLEHADSTNAGVDTASLGRINARVLRLPQRYDEQSARYLDRVASRISLSIQTEEIDPHPVADRYGKAPVVNGTLPIRRRGAWLHDDSVHGHIYRNAYEEREDIIRSMRDLHAKGERWSDMAIIAHDNSSVQSFGKYLREQGIPVEFSSQSTPLAQDPTVQGLFAAIELAQLRTHGLQDIAGEYANVKDIIRRVNFLMQRLIESPLCTVAPERIDAVQPNTISSNLSDLTAVGNQWHNLTQALRSLSQVAQIAHEARIMGTTPKQVVSETSGQSAQASTQTPEVTATSAKLISLTDAWQRLKQALQYVINHNESTQYGQSVHIDAIVMQAGVESEHPESAEISSTTSESTTSDNATSDSTEFDISAFEELYGDVDIRAQLTMSALLMLLVDSQEYADFVLDVMQDISHSTAAGSTHYARMIAVMQQVTTMIREISETLREHDTAEAVLAAAWQSSNVADYWQVLALNGASEESALSSSQDALIRASSLTQIAFETNARLDTVIKLFAHAASNPQQRIVPFIAAMNALSLEADSLVQQTPQLDAVLLTTPAGSVGLHIPYVWLPSVQQGTWPNLTPRGTMFGIDELADRMMHGKPVSTNQGSQLSQFDRTNQLNRIDQPDHIDQRHRVLASEQRLLLMALTRATQQVTLSAVQSDDMAVSDFAVVYLPELFWNTISEERRQELLQQSGEPDDGEGSVPPSASMPYTEAATDMSHGGMQLDPRSLVAQARMQSIAQSAALSDAHNAAEPQLAELQSVERQLVEDEVSGTKSVHTDDSAHDADRALALLARNHYEVANPWHWAFVQDARVAHEREQAKREVCVESARASANSSVSASASTPRTNLRATLSPSDVSTINDCAICWKMDRHFSGPITLGSSRQVGNWIHAVAQKATLLGLDLPENQPKESEFDYVGDYVKDKLQGLAELLRPDSDDDSIEDRFSELKREETIDNMLYNLSRYFVYASSPNYEVDIAIANAGRSDKGNRIGHLDAVLPEQPFAATIPVRELIKAVKLGLAGKATGIVNSNDELQQLHLSDEQVIALWKILTPKWSEDPQSPVDVATLEIALRGEIDRIEFRTLDDGTQVLRVIDYKTGSLAAKDSYSNMQLMCYQLGLHYGLIYNPKLDSESVENADLYSNTNTDGNTDSHNTAVDEGELRTVNGVRFAELQERAKHNRVAQASLFAIASSYLPAQSRSGETAYQPPLFGQRLNGALGGKFQDRLGYRSVGSFWKCDTWPAERPEIFDEHTWQMLCACRDTQTMWSVYMVGMLVRAAVASLSEEFTVTDVPKKHLDYCRYNTVCPSCAQHVSTVIEQE